jgi:DivIVA domain-containing protein
VTSRARGYAVDAVDSFLKRAAEGGTGVTSDEIRGAQFPLVKGGYRIDSVDSALDQLEDTMADNERRDAVNRIGNDAVTADSRALAQTILDRVARPAGQRFRRAAFFTYGYNRNDVDAFTDRVREFYNDGQSLSRTDVRSITFRPQVGGYDEAQVDFVLDELVRVMLAAR